MAKCAGNFRSGVDVKKHLLMAGLSILCCVLSVQVVYSDGPRAVIPETAYNFGTALQRSVISHIFKLKNSGNADLILENPIITGRDTTVKFRRQLSPDQESEVTLKVETNNLAGEVESEVIFGTNDPLNPNIALKITGTVRPLIEVRPMATFFFSVYKGESQEKSVEIVNNDQESLKITKIESSSDRFTYQLKTIREGQEYQLSIKIKPETVSGRTMEKLTLFTDNDKRPQIRIGINILVKNDVYSFPDEIDLGEFKLKELNRDHKLTGLLGQTALVIRRAGKGKDFRIKIEHDVPFIKIKKDPESGSETYRLDVSLIPEKLAPGKIDTFIRVTTNDKDVPELKIPVIGTVD